MRHVHIMKSSSFNTQNIVTRLTESTEIARGKNVVHKANETFSVTGIVDLGNER